MDPLTARAIIHHKITGCWPNEILESRSDIHHRYTRISPASLRSIETPNVGEKTNIDFGVWIIQPTEGVFLRVELV